jgi:hypothetical protein
MKLWTGLNTFFVFPLIKGMDRWSFCLRSFRWLRSRLAPHGFSGFGVGAKSGTNVNE